MTSGEADWHDVPTVLGGIHVNVGSLLSRWSHGRWQVCGHTYVPVARFAAPASRTSFAAQQPFISSLLPAQACLHRVVATESPRLSLIFFTRPDPLVPLVGFVPGAEGDSVAFASSEELDTAPSST